jgi:putative ABC transport system permease protein
MGDFWRDLRFAARTLAKSPGFTVVAVLALGLAMGVNSAVFGALRSLVLRALPVAHPEGLVAVSMRTLDQGRGGGPVSYPDYQTLRRETGIFSDLMASAIDTGSISDDGSRQGGRGERAATAVWELISGNTFQELGVQPELGRALTPQDDAPGAEPVIVISDALWRRRYNAEHSAIGRRLFLGSFAVTIVGVMPPSWKGLQANILAPGFFNGWMTLSTRALMYANSDSTFASDRGRRALAVIGRLQPGVTIAQARARLDALAPILAREFPATNAGAGFAVVPEIEGRWGEMFPTVEVACSLALFTAGLVLLISCANVANLLLARAARRTREIGIRVALGAGRRRIIAQLLTESMLLALLGGGLGLLVANWFGDLMHLFLPPTPVRLDLDVRADGLTLAWAFVAAVLSGVVFGAAPAWRATRISVVTALKTDAGAQGQRRRTGLRQVLVIAQVAISIMVLACGGLLLRSLQKIKAIDPGFRTENLVTATVNPSLFTDDVGQHHRFFDELQRRLLGHPAVVAASSARYMPLVNAQGELPVLAEGEAPPPPNEARNTAYSVAYHRYFSAAGTQILLGRDFHDSDHTGTPSVAIVNRELARRLFGQPEQALGRRIHVGGPATPLLQVVGITRDGRYDTLLESPKPWLFLPESLPWASDPNEGLRVVLVRAASAAQLTVVVEALRAGVEKLDPRVPLEDLRVGDGQLAMALYAPRLAAELGSLLGLLALVLATMGIYSVMTYAVSQRTREIGIRVALGGQVRDVVRLVLGQGLSLIATGVVVGAVGVLIGARVLRGLLFGVGVADPLALAGAVVLLVTVGVLATLIPARRAARVDPVVALRQP